MRERAIRLSSHPGQYTVLNSEKPDTQAAAIAELEVQAALMDAMGLGPEAVVVLHVGGAAGGLDAAAIASSPALSASPSAPGRGSSSRTTTAPSVLSTCSRSARSGVRIVWDVLHHRCHDPAGMSNREALAAALDTWRNGDGLPKIHYSSPRLDVEKRRVKVGRRTETKLVLPQLRAHADLIDPIGFEAFLREAPAGRSFDIMLEAKAKDLALLRLRDQLAERGLLSAGGSVLVAGS